MEIEISNSIRSLVESIADIYRNNLNDSRSSGKLQDFQTDIIIDSNRFVIVFELEDYWKYVENGRPAGKQPPISAIEEWIRVKPIIPDSRSGRIPDTRQLAYLISRKIGRDGTPPQLPLKRMLESSDTDSLLNLIKQEIITQIKSYIEDDEIS